MMLDLAGINISSLFINTDTIPKSSYTENRSESDATTNLCKSVKSVSFYIFRHRFTQILPKVGVNRITDFWNSARLGLKKTLEKTKSRLSKIAPMVFVSSKDRSGTTILRYKIPETANKKVGEILVGSLGYPNTGKSSVINAVTGRHRAGTSSISGHIKGVQHINAGSRIKFIDTPGGDSLWQER